jgi:hypothetical protein
VIVLLATAAWVTVAWLGPAQGWAASSDDSSGASDVRVTVPRPASPTASATASPTASPTPSSTAWTPGPPASTTGGGGGSNPGGGSSGGSSPGSGGDSDDGSGGDGDPCAQTEPPLPPAPAEDASAATVDQGLYLPGNKVTATATGYSPGEQVQLVLFSQPRLLGNFTADAAGQVQAVFAVPDDAPPGTHMAQFTGWCGNLITSAEVLVGVAPDPPAESGLPAWVWWLVVVLILIALALVARRIVRLMRERPGGAETPL